jgi:hypothetical protein
MTFTSVSSTNLSGNYGVTYGNLKYGHATFGVHELDMSVLGRPTILSLSYRCCAETVSHQGSLIKRVANTIIECEMPVLVVVAELLAWKESIRLPRRSNVWIINKARPFATRIIVRLRRDI